MSRAADLSVLLSEKLQKYDESCHKAIVETFMDAIGDNWDEEYITYFATQGLNISESADEEIKHQLSCWGLN